jgi:hypothetical protein
MPAVPIDLKTLHKEAVAFWLQTVLVLEFLF